MTLQGHGKAAACSERKQGQEGLPLRDPEMVTPFIVKFVITPQSHPELSPIVTPHNQAPL